MEIDFKANSDKSTRVKSLISAKQKADMVKLIKQGKSAREAYKLVASKDT